MKTASLRAGAWVEVRTKEEILATLDAAGRLEGMPFMPEMFAFCGTRFRVYKRAHKTCDTVFPVRGRRVQGTVHLETRCDGSAHDGCQAGCLVFWKEAWLKRIDRNTAPGPSSGNGCTEAAVFAYARSVPPGGDEPLYACQATQLPYATTGLDWWEFDQYIEDYRSGNVGLWRIVCGGVYFLFLWLTRVGFGLGRPIRWLWDTLYRLWGGSPFPRRKGEIPAGQRTPSGALDLQPGELVRIKPYREILESLDTTNRNRGLYFDAEEVPYCGGTYRVLKRVTRIIQERTGKMLVMKTPSIVLDGVICESRYSECRLFCPRSIYAYWRETWLERVTPAEAPAIPKKPVTRRLA